MAAHSPKSKVVAGRQENADSQRKEGKRHNELREEEDPSMSSGGGADDSDGWLKRDEGKSS